MYAQVDELRALARNVRSTLGSVHSDENALRRMGACFQDWMSPAAEQFNTGYYQASFRVYRNVQHDLNALAGILERAAEQLQRVKERLAGIEQDVRAFFARPPNWVCPDNKPPLWETQGWRYQPRNLPRSGDPEWLDVDSYFKNRLGIAL